MNKIIKKRMSSNTGLKKGKGAIILLLLILVISINILALFIYFAETNKKTQPVQSLKVLDEGTPLEYLSAVKEQTENTNPIEDIYLIHSSRGSSSSSSSSSNSNNNNNNGIGSPDDECENFGFDFGVAKWTCNGAWSLDEEIYPGTSVAGNCDEAFWDVGASSADGVVIKAGDIEQIGGVYYSEQGTTGTINLDKDISHITFCGYSGNSYCNDNQDCPNDSYSDKYCYNTDVYRNLTDYFCFGGSCLFNITQEFIQDCGTESYSDEYCYNNDIYQNHSTPGCENGGCILSTEKNKIQDCGEDSCDDWSDYVCEGKNKTRTRTCYDRGCEQQDCFSDSDQEKESQECDYDCANGECTEPQCGDGHLDAGEECDDGNLINGDGCDEFCKFEITCFNNSQCGIDGWINQDYCVCTTDVWDTWKVYECKNPGTPESYCTNRLELRLKQDCGEDSCTDYENYCEDNDIWKKRTCQDVGCALGACFNNTILNTSFVQDCGEDSCDDWSDYVCEGKNKTRTRTCYDRGCEQQDCFSDSDQEKESQECDYDCANGECTEPQCGDGHLDAGEECDDGNLINGDGCDEFCEVELCEHDVGIRYSYGNSFETGIAIKLNGTNEWLEDPVELLQDQDHIIKYIIDNKIENTTNNIHVIVTLNTGGIIGYKVVNERGGGENPGDPDVPRDRDPTDVPIYGNTTILADYNTSINNYHTGEVDLSTYSLSVGTYNLSVYVEKINEIDCNLSDNYAERQITIKTECCDDSDCSDDSYSENYCLNNNIWRDFIDNFCENGNCLFDIIPELFINCGNETYSDEYCYDNDIYQNHSTPGCENSQCTLNNEINKIQDCGEDSYEEIKYCNSDDVWINKTQELRGCEQAQCFFSSELTSELFEECGQDSCNSWSDYVCEGKNKTRTRTCYDRGCEQQDCFSDSDQEKESQECDYDCVDGECIDEPVCGDGHLDAGEECDDGNLINGDGCDENCKIEECCDDEDCPDDIFSYYCYYNDLWKNLTDYFCQNGNCLFNISSIFFQDCGETIYGEWNYYCIGKEIWKEKTDIFRGCSNSECYENEDYENEYIDYCEQECIDGECIGECETDEDCPADYYDPSYCGGDTCPESVFKDFHDFSCTPRKKCAEEITPILIDHCDFTCLDNRCVSEECDGVDLSNCEEWVECVCVVYKE